MDIAFRPMKMSEATEHNRRMPFRILLLRRNPSLSQSSNSRARFAARACNSSSCRSPPLEVYWERPRPAMVRRSGSATHEKRQAPCQGATYLRGQRGCSQICRPSRCQAPCRATTPKICPAWAHLSGAVPRGTARPNARANDLPNRGG